jgi:hypothetical protein
VFVYLAGVIGTGGGLLLIMGLLTRLAALALAADMIGAIVVSGLARGELISLTLAPCCCGDDRTDPPRRRPLVTRAPDHPADPLGGASSSEDIPGPGPQTVATASTPRSPMNGESKWDRH